MWLRQILERFLEQIRQPRGASTVRWSPSGWSQLECRELYLTQSSTTIRFLKRRF